MRSLAPALLLLLALPAAPALARGPSGNQASAKFAQLDPELPTPDGVHLATGAPGPDYWQQRVDYRIEARLDEAARVLSGTAHITYHNNSPHALDYLWVQLDQNRFRKGSASRSVERAPSDFGKYSYRWFRREFALQQFDGGYTIQAVKDRRGRTLPHTVVDTMMRVEVPQPIRSGERFRFSVEYRFPIVDAEIIGGRGGYEALADGAEIFTIAQWYPRMAVYGPDTGWQNKAFLGRGEFALEFGDFDVELTVPADHVLAATGTLKNPRDVLTAAQRERLEQARKAFDKPVLIVTGDEAKAAREAKPAARPKGTRTWKFSAENVRDFAWASSRTFWWDALAVKIGGRTVMAMSAYPAEAAPLWTPYSSHAVAHTLEVYSRMTVDYPWPVCWSINGPVGGMEYPMVTFNGPRAEDDGTYYDVYGEGKPWNRSKYGLISVVIHEVGHNWFPMIINSDERQWTWLDEGLNTFLQFITEQEWEPDYPSWRGYPDAIVPYMTDPDSVPIMTNSESLLQFGNNAYAKPATALNILRETVLGRTLFDMAFKTYAQRWAFRRPTPADLFRTLEDASGVDLDWFWRGWFYTTDHVDQGIERLRVYRLETRDPAVDKAIEKKERDERRAQSLTWQRNQGMKTRVDRFEHLKDFYNGFDPLDVTPEDTEAYEKLLKDLEPWEKDLLKTKAHVQVLDLVNAGQVVMPVILKLTYEGGASEVRRLPAEVWTRDDRSFSQLLITERPVVAVELDPFHEIADADRTNNVWPSEPKEGQFQLYKRSKRPSPMKVAKDRAEKAKKKAEEEAKKKAEGAAKGDGGAAAQPAEAPASAAE
ncbi:MAG: M1 family metallopeptidase [Myxococcales bacterium]|nr:M1 family metallopeptidase [Myxococcales bacterium]